MTEGTSTKAWIVDRDGQLVTRDPHHAILPGVTRRVILEAAAEAQIPIDERAFTPEEALNGARGLHLVGHRARHAGGGDRRRTIGDGKPGPLTRRMQELYGRSTAGITAAEVRP